MQMLGKLQKVNLRDVWNTEDRHFTPWLAQNENIEILGATLNLELQVQDVERYVGNYRADIVCENTEDSSLVLIENQLSKTDHSHLGQILTYAAGTKANTVIWIAERFSEEHREAMDWLNQNAGETLQFFGLEIELWRIDESAPAPKFNIISKPNDWTLTVRRVTRALASDGLSETKEIYFRYWSAFTDYLNEINSPLRGGRKARPQHWMPFAVGRSGFHLSCTISAQKQRVGVELHINADDAEGFFHALQLERSAIEQEIGARLDWMEMPGKKASRIVLYRNCNPLNGEDWKNQFAWMGNVLEKMRMAFSPRIKQLSPYNPVIDEAL